MPTRRMRIELFDGDGNKYSISFEGQVTREKALRLLDLVELLGGAPSGGGSPSSSPVAGGSELSKFERVRVIIQRHFPIVWFSSREVQSVYEQEFRDPITLSTVATYLARMATRGIVSRTGPSNSLKYKVALTIPEATVKHRIS